MALSGGCHMLIFLDGNVKLMQGLCCSSQINTSHQLQEKGQKKNQSSISVHFVRELEQMLKNGFIIFIVNYLKLLT